MFRSSPFSYVDPSLITKPVRLIYPSFSSIIHPNDVQRRLNCCLSLQVFYFLQELLLDRSSLITQTQLWEFPCLIMLECLRDVRGAFWCYVRTADQFKLSRLESSWSGLFSGVLCLRGLGGFLIRALFPVKFRP